MFDHISVHIWLYGDVIGWTYLTMFKYISISELEYIWLEDYLWVGVYIIFNNIWAWSILDSIFWLNWNLVVGDVISSGSVTEFMWKTMKSTEYMLQIKTELIVQAVLCHCFWSVVLMISIRSWYWVSIYSWRCLCVLLRLLLLLLMIRDLFHTGYFVQLFNHFSHKTSFKNAKRGPDSSILPICSFQSCGCYYSLQPRETLLPPLFWQRMRDCFFLIEMLTFKRVRLFAFLSMST